VDHARLAEQFESSGVRRLEDLYDIHDLGTHAPPIGKAGPRPELVLTGHLESAAGGGVAVEKLPAQYLRGHGRASVGFGPCLED
jgi:hypothetical protein